MRVSKHVPGEEKPKSFPARIRDTPSTATHPHRTLVAPPPPLERLVHTTGTHDWYTRLVRTTGTRDWYARPVHSRYRLDFPLFPPFDAPPPTARPPRSSPSSPARSSNRPATKIRSPSLARAVSSSENTPDTPDTPGTEVVKTTLADFFATTLLEDAAAPASASNASRRAAAAADAGAAVAASLPLARVSPMTVNRRIPTRASRSNAASAAAASFPGAGNRRLTPRAAHPGRPARPALCAYASAHPGARPRARRVRRPRGLIRARRRPWRRGHRTRPREGIEERRRAGCGKVAVERRHASSPPTRRRVRRAAFLRREERNGVRGGCGGGNVVVARWGDVRREGSVSRFGFAPSRAKRKQKPKPKPKKKKKSFGVVVLSGFRNRASLGRCRLHRPRLKGLQSLTCEKGDRHRSTRIGSGENDGAGGSVRVGAASSRAFRHVKVSMSCRNHRHSQGM